MSQPEPETTQSARLASVAIAVGVCALPLSAQATVVLYSTPQSFNTAVLGFNPATGAIGPNQSSQFSFTFQTATLNGTTSADAISSASGAAVKYNAGDTIGPNAFNGGTGTASNTATLNFPKNPYFIGLEIAVNVPSGAVAQAALPPSALYGFAEITVDNSSNGVVLEYAFQTDGSPITIPSGVPVPEPASLALLAMGAATVGAFRRRKSAG